MLLARTAAARLATGASAAPLRTASHSVSLDASSTDQNPQTGGLAYTGADSMLDLSFNSVDLASWNGSDFHVMDQSPGSLVWSYANGVATIGGSPAAARPAGGSCRKGRSTSGCTGWSPSRCRDSR